MSLPLFDPPSRAPKVSDSDLAWMIRVLTGRQWVTAKQLKDFASDRKLRAIAEVSEGRIVSGQKGYALVEAVTVDEANHAAAWLEHQAKKMLTRAQQIRRAMHKRPSAA